MNLCITEYDEERTHAELKEDAREDGRKEGRKEGLEEGKLEMILNMLGTGTVSIEDIAKFAGFTVERIKEIAAQNNFVKS